MYILTKNTMNFDDLYLKIVLEAKRYELVWFHVPAATTNGHAMPFLSRNLLYIRMARRRRHHHRHANRPIMTEPNKVVSSNHKDKSKKKLDLLFSIFHHRTVLYNDALLFASSLRRATRNLMESSSQNITTTPTTTTTTPNKGKTTPRSIPSETSTSPPEQQTKKRKNDSNAAVAMKDNNNNNSSEEDSSRNSAPAKKKTSRSQSTWPHQRKKLETATATATANETSKHGMSMSPLSSSSSSSHDDNKSGGDGLLHVRQPVSHPPGKERGGNRKNGGGGGPYYLSTTLKAETKMFFHLPFIDKNGAPSIHVEEAMREERKCPLCFHNAMSDSGLIMHCSASHGEDLIFKAARSELGELHVSATPKHPCVSPWKKDHLMNFMFVASSPQTTENTLTAAAVVAVVPFVKRPAPNIASLELAARKKKARLLEEMGADPRDTQRYILDDKVPIRDYYHSKTKQPMLHGDWDIDSDDDSTDDQWLCQIGASLLDDFEDVSENEKKFLKAWNRFIRSHTLISDFSIPGRCMEFVKTHASFLNANDLRQDLTLHLYNLWDNGLVSSLHILECMMEYDSLIRN